MLLDCCGTDRPFPVKLPVFFQQAADFTVHPEIGIDQQEILPLVGIQGGFQDGMAEVPVEPAAELCQGFRFGKSKDQRGVKAVL